MRVHRNPRPSLSKRPSPDNAEPDIPIEGAPTAALTFDIAAAMSILREIIARTAALVTATEDALEKDPWSADAEDHGDRVEHLAHLLASAKEAAYAAVEAGDQIADGLAKRGRA